MGTSDSLGALLSWKWKLGLLREMQNFYRGGAGGCSAGRSSEWVWLNLHVFLIWDVFVGGDGPIVLGRDLSI